MSERLVCGVGINDVHTCSRRLFIDPFYVAWAGMLKRCYSKKYLERYPAYKGCSVSQQWLTFSAFKEWMETQKWQGMVLDKDLLVQGNKVYGPETCLFIPAWLNAFLSSLTPSKRELPIGVSLREGRYRARYKVQERQVSLGGFGTPEEAHLAYRAYRLTEIQNRLNVYQQSPSPDPAVTAALQNLYALECAKVCDLHLASISGK